MFSTATNVYLAGVIICRWNQRDKGRDRGTSCCPLPAEYVHHEHEVLLVIKVSRVRNSHNSG
jgi:hypothetical protein